MFAVPGWSLSSSNLVPQANRADRARQPAELRVRQLGQKSASKRKRASKQPSHATVTPEDLTELWERHISKSSKGDDKAVYEKHNKTESPYRHQNPFDATKARLEVSSRQKAQNLSGDEHESSFLHESMKSNCSKRKKRAELPELALSCAEDISQSQASAGATVDIVVESKETADSPSTPATLTPLQSGMRQKLTSARFRYLNQILYTSPSSSSSDLFCANPSFFAEYHEGFQRQVGGWPENPVLAFVSWILKRAGCGVEPTSEHRKLDSQKSSFRKVKARATLSAPDMPSPDTHAPGFQPQIEPLPRDRRSNLCTIADLGCGSALLARTLAPKSRLLHLRIHSFDLCASDPLITAADISRVPLPDSSVDVAIICLALMGTNWLDFVEEAYRLLRWKGECWIAEVASRFIVTRLTTGKVGVRKNRQKKGKGAWVATVGRKQDAEKEPQHDGLFRLEEYDELSATRTSGMDIQKTFDPFIAVLRTRGFELLGELEVGNKMFVRMRFVKSLTPTRGKGVPRPGTQRFQGTRFLEKEKHSEETVGIEEEAKVLKPCVYKNR